MKIDIISDTICPWCFIGKRRLEQALETRPQSDLEISWRPFQLNPDMPADGMEREAYLAAKFGGRDRAGRAYQTIAQAGGELGIDFRFDRIRRTPNTVDSHRLIHRAGENGVQDDVVEALFRAYFQDGRNIGDTQVLADVAAGAGLERDDILDYLRSDEDAAYIRAEDDRVRLQGVNGVPCFIIDGEYAVSGAQSPEVFHQLFDLVSQNAVAAAAAE